MENQIRKKIGNPVLQQCGCGLQQYVTHMLSVQMLTQTVATERSSFAIVQCTYYC